MFYRSIFTIILLCVVQSVWAQPVVTEIQDYRARKMRADSVMAEWRSGAILIVRIPSQFKKVEKLESLYPNVINPRKKKKVKKLLAKAKIRHEKFSKDLVRGFYEHYQSDFLIMYDTSGRLLNNGTQSGIFLDKDLNIDNTLDLNNRKYIMLRYGLTDYITTQRIHGLIFADSNLRDMEKPFPYFFPLDYNYYSWLAKIFPELFNSPIKAAIRINRMMQRYH